MNTAIQESAAGDNLEGQLTAVRRAALEYRKQGLNILPLKTGCKNPSKPDGTDLSGWPEYVMTDVDTAFTDKASNIGIRLDDPWTDIDLDCPEAIQLADDFLPATISFGRASTPRAHRIYKAEGAGYKKYDASFGTVLELRAEDRHQTMFPPSVHESGEPLVWTEGQKTVQDMDAADLRRRCDLLAVSAVLAHHWVRSTGRRDELAVAVSRLLMDHAGLSVDESSSVVSHICRVAGDEERQDRIKKACSVARGGKKYGIPTIVEIIGKEDAGKILEWLGKQSPDTFSEEPVDFFALPPAPELNLDHIPPLIARRAKDVAERIGCNIENAVFPGIIAIGAAAGRNAVIQPKKNDPSFLQMPTLYGCIVQPSGMLKSPPANEMFEPIVSMHQSRLADWREKCTGIPAAERPDEPAPLYVTNTTTEALIRDLNFSPGILFFANELAGMMKAANQYKGAGNDAELILEIYDGYASSTRRKTTGNIDVERPCVGVYGTIQPDVAATVLVTGENEANGLMARFGLCAYPQPRQDPMLDRVVDRQAEEAYKTTLTALMQTFGDGEFPEGPCRFTLEDPSLYLQWVNDERAKNLKREPPIQTHCAKYPGLLARLTLVFHLAELECSRGLVEPDGSCSSRVKDLQGQTVIPAATVEQAIAFIDEYLRPHLARVYCLGESDERGAKEGRAIAKLIIDEQIDDVTVTQICDRHRAGLRTTTNVAAGLKYLDRMGWGSFNAKDQSRSRKPAARFHVNPAAHERQWFLDVSTTEENH